MIPTYKEKTLGRVPTEGKTLKAFFVTTETGISYHPGVWHHPLIALGRVTNFACIVSEDNTQGDCEEKILPKPLLIDIV